MLTTFLFIVSRNCKYTRFPLKEECMNNVIFHTLMHAASGINFWNIMLQCKNTYTKDQVSYDSIYIK